MNDFNKFGRTYQVRVQAEPKFRAEPDDIARLEVRNRDGQMVPLGTRGDGPQVVRPADRSTATTCTRRRRSPASPAPGVSSGEALDLMEQIASRTLPPSMGYEWTGMAFQEKRVGGEAISVFALAVLLVYLVLAAQYESWFTPLAVILVVPLGLLGAVGGGVAPRHGQQHLHADRHRADHRAGEQERDPDRRVRPRPARPQGKSDPRGGGRSGPAAVPADPDDVVRVHPRRACRWCSPTGAGAAGQQALGTAVFGGMIASTILAVFFVPVFYVVFQSLAEAWYAAAERRQSRIEEDEELPLFAEPEMALAH